LLTAILNNVNTNNQWNPNSTTGLVEFDGIRRDFINGLLAYADDYPIVSPDETFVTNPARNDDDAVHLSSASIDILSEYSLRRNRELTRDFLNARQLMFTTEAAEVISGSNDVVYSWRYQPSQPEMEFVPNTKAVFIPEGWRGWGSISVNIVSARYGQQGSGFVNIPAGQTQTVFSLRGQNGQAGRNFLVGTTIALEEHEYYSEYYEAIDRHAIVIPIYLRNTSFTNDDGASVRLQIQASEVVVANPVNTIYGDEETAKSVLQIEPYYSDTSLVLAEQTYNRRLTPLKMIRCSIPLQQRTSSGFDLIVDRIRDGGVYDVMMENSENVRSILMNCRMIYTDRAPTVMELLFLESPRVTALDYWTYGVSRWDVDTRYH